VQQKRHGGRPARRGRDLLPLGKIRRSTGQNQIGQKKLEAVKNEIIEGLSADIKSSHVTETKDIDFPLRGASGGFVVGLGGGQRIKTFKEV